MANASFNFKFQSSADIIMNNVGKALKEASAELKEKSIEWVQEKMLYGYSDPHGEDGHTEIVDTGATFDSVNAEIKGASQNAFTVRVGVGTDYAVYVHNGTRKLKGRPFLRDALMDNTENIKQIVESKLKD